MSNPKPPYIGQIVHYLYPGIDAMKIQPHIVAAMVVAIADDQVVKLRLFHPHNMGTSKVVFARHGNEERQWREIS